MTLRQGITRSVFSCVCFTALCCPARAHAQTPVAADFAQDVKPLLAQHCVRCHGEEKQEGDFRIDTLERDFANVRVATHWTEMMDRINTGEMPPKAEPRPPADELRAWPIGSPRNSPRPNPRARPRRVKKSPFAASRAKSIATPSATCWA